MTTPVSRGGMESTHYSTPNKNGTLNNGLHIYWRRKSLSPKARFTKWAECEYPFLTMHENNCGYESIKSLKYTLENVSEGWTLRQRTSTFFGFEEKDMRKPVCIVQFRIKFKKKT